MSILKEWEMAVTPFVRQFPRKNVMTKNNVLFSINFTSNHMSCPSRTVIVTRCHAHKRETRNTNGCEFPVWWRPNSQRDGQRLRTNQSFASCKLGTSTQHSQSHPIWNIQTIHATHIHTKEFRAVLSTIYRTKNGQVGVPSYGLLLHVDKTTFQSSDSSSKAANFYIRWSVQYSVSSCMGGGWHRRSLLRSKWGKV